MVIYTPNCGFRGNGNTAIVFRFPRFETDSRTKSDTLNPVITVK